jgi:hypothetical protein
MGEGWREEATSLGEQPLRGIPKRVRVALERLHDLEAFEAPNIVRQWKPTTVP